MDSVPISPNFSLYLNHCQLHCQGLGTELLFFRQHQDQPSKFAFLSSQHRHMDVSRARNLFCRTGRTITSRLCGQPTSREKHEETAHKATEVAEDHLLDNPISHGSAGQMWERALGASLGSKGLINRSSKERRLRGRTTCEKCPTSHPKMGWTPNPGLIHYLSRATRYIYK